MSTSSKTVLLLFVVSALLSSPQPMTASVVDGQPFFVALSVRDVEASASWYERIFGYREVRAVDLGDRGLRVRLLRREGAFLELIESREARDLGELEPPIEKRHHLRGVFKTGFVVADLQAVVQRLESLEVKLRGTIVVERDRTMRSLQIEDPDGNVIQLFERLSD